LITRLSTTPNGKDQTALLQLILSPMRQNSLEDTCRTRTSYLSSKPRGLSAGVPDVSSSVTSHTRFFTQSISKPQRKCHHFSREKGLLAEC